MNRDLLPSAYDVSRRRIRLVTSQNAVHFLAEAHWPATIATGAGVGRIGRTSYVASTALFIGGSCIGVCDTVLVALGDDGPVALPDEFRAALQTVLLGEHRSCLRARRRKIRWRVRRDCRRCRGGVVRGSVWWAPSSHLVRWAWLTVCGAILGRGLDRP